MKRKGQHLICVLKKLGKKNLWSFPIAKQKKPIKFVCNIIRKEILMFLAICFLMFLAVCQCCCCGMISLYISQASTELYPATSPGVMASNNEPSSPSGTPSKSRVDGKLTKIRVGRARFLSEGGGGLPFTTRNSTARPNPRRVAS